MIKDGIAEITGIGMAIPARPGIMILGRRVTNRAVGITNGSVIEDKGEEVAGIGMASTACSLVVVGRRGMTDRAVGCPAEAVIKVHVRPGIDGMATGTISAIATVMGVIGGVASNAGGVCAPVRSVNMARGAAQISMTAGQWEKIVGNCLIRAVREGHDARGI